MARVRKRITLKKAAQTFLMYSVAVGGALTQVEIPEGDLTDKALITLGVSTLAAVLRAVNNVRKTRRKPTDTGYGGVYYGGLLACVVALAAGCMTTTAPDGTVTQSVDLTTAWEVYERYEALEAERDAADAAGRARLDAELRALEPELREAARRLGIAEY